MLISGLLQRIEYHRQALPSDEDLLGAVAALMRLQDTYQLDTAKLAQGDINGIQASELTGTGRVSLSFFCLLQSVEGE